MQGQKALFKYHLMLTYRQALRRFANAVRGRKPVPTIQCRVPVSKIRKLIIDRDAHLTPEGNISWFYGIALERGDNDPLTNHELGYVKNNVAKDAAVLITGCGTGIMLFHLMDVGFKRVDGFDYLQTVVDVANDIKQLGQYEGCNIWQADGFRPNLTGQYDAIIAVHWIYSAWHGNYGNSGIPFEEAKKPAKREELLTDFLAQYAPHINPGGFMIVELTDAVADYRLSSDSSYAALETIYPVRFTPAQVEACAQRNGLTVEDYKMSIVGPQPRTCYRLRKPAIH